MSKLIVDTNKLLTSGNDIISLTRELNEQINILFSRISNMNSNTLEWVGASANEFIRQANIQKSQYVKMIQILNKYGNVLKNAANYYETSKESVINF